MKIVQVHCSGIFHRLILLGVSRTFICEVRGSNVGRGPMNTNKIFLIFSLLNFQANIINTDLIQIINAQADYSVFIIILLSKHKENF